MHGRDTSKYKVVRAGDFAYATIHLDEGSIGRLIDYDSGIVSPMYTVFRVDETIDPEYLYAVLKSPSSLQLFQRLGQGSVNRRASIGFRTLQRVMLRHPPLPEQCKIAATLSSVDEVIEETEAVIEQLQVVKKAMMQELLTRGLPGRHTRFKRTELGEIPDDWEVLSIGDCLERGILEEHQDGNHGSLYPRKAEFGASGVPFLSAKHIHGDQVSIEEAPRLAEPRARKLRIGWTRPGDVLLAHNATVGPVARVPEFDGDLLLGTSLTYFRPDPERLDTTFLATSLSGPGFQGQLYRTMKQSTRNQVPITKQRTLLIALPSIEEQLELGESFDPVVRNVLSEEGTLDAVRQVKAALMSVLLTGEVRVTPDGEAA